MKYDDIRHDMQIGDLMAFGGNGFVSKAIKAFTGSDVSHVGAVLYSYVAGRRLVQIIESTSLGEGMAGVKINRMSDHVLNYDGDIWWYPLRKDIRRNFNDSLFISFMLKMKGRSYDKKQALFSALDLSPDTSEDFEKLFCSELVAESYEQAGAMGPLNASEMTPKDVVSFDIYDPRIKVII